METISFTNMQITNVFQHIPQPDTIDIYFKLQGDPYCIRNEKENGFYKPVAIYHEFNDQCKICGKGRALNNKGTFCFTLLEQPCLNDLFQILIQTPNIRLEWIYLPHEEIEQ